jgi:hypothetical protein
VENRAQSEVTLNALVKALSAIPSPDSEKLLVEVAEMNESATVRGAIMEVMQYKSLSNAMVDEYLEKVVREEGNTDIVRKAKDSLAYRQLRRKMVRITAVLTSNLGL